LLSYDVVLADKLNRLASCCCEVSQEENDDNREPEHLRTKVRWQVIAMQSFRKECGAHSISARTTFAGVDR
jgi:hypothetical protein